MKIDSYKTDPLFLVERHVIESRKILAESCIGLRPEQKKIVEGIYNVFSPLIRESALLEQTLSADQINKIFGNVEQQLSSQPGNRTALGKGKDVASKANDIINQAGSWLQKTTPVKGFDNKFDELKNTINTKFPDSKILDAVSSMGTWAKENPGKTAAVIGILTTIAALAGGPIGGAIAGQVLRGTTELLKGEKLSTAVGKGIKTAAIGAAIGAVSSFMQDALGGSYVSTEGTFYVNGQEVSQEEYAQHMKGKGFADPMNPTADELQKATGQQLPDNVKSQISQQSGLPQPKPGGFADTVEKTSDAQRAAKGFTGGGIKDPNFQESRHNRKEFVLEEVVYNLKPLSESMVAVLFKRVTMTNYKMISEGVIWEQGNEPEGQKPSFMQKVMGKASEIGKNLTTKVTASKLMSAWKQAEVEPDSDSIAEFLKGQGINDQVIAQTFKDMQLPSPGTGKTTAEIAAIKKEIAALDPETAKQLLGLLSQKAGATAQ
jgi:hypothetical protein